MGSARGWASWSRSDRPTGWVTRWARVPATPPAARWAQRWAMWRAPEYERERERRPREATRAAARSAEGWGLAARRGRPRRWARRRRRSIPPGWDCRWWPWRERRAGPPGPLPPPNGRAAPDL